MKHPRRIDLSAEMIALHHLSAAPPPPDSLFWTLWSSCTAIAQQALQTPFVQGIKTGTLDPGVYGAFNVSDAYYCFDGARDYSAAAKRAKDPTLKAYLEIKQQGYAKYNATFPTTWRIKDTSAVVPFDVTRHYAEYESSVVTGKDPIYALIVMLPCEFLWYWLATQLQPTTPQNLYNSWITGNDDSKGPFTMGNFLNSYQQANPDAIDEKTAIEIYTKAMTFERDNFAAATS